MARKIDWQEILDLAGDEPYHDSYVSLPAVSRHLLAQLVSDDRYLVRGRDNVDYGTAYQDELYRYALTAYNNLMNPIDISSIMPDELARYAAVSEIMTMPNLAAFWPMSASYKNPADPSSGATVADVSGNGWHLDSVGYPKLGEDGGPCLILDGSAEYLKSMSSPHLAVDGTEVSSSAQGFTLCGMIKPTDSGVHRSVLGRFGFNNYEQCFFVSRLGSDYASFRIDDGGGNHISVVSPIEPGEWSFFCARYKLQDSIRIMVDGQESNQTTSMLVNGYEGSEFTVGKITAGPTYFMGNMSMIWVSQSFVSDDRINHLRDLLLPLYGKEL